MPPENTKYFHICPLGKPRFHVHIPNVVNYKYLFFITCYSVPSFDSISRGFLSFVYIGFLIRFWLWLFIVFFCCYLSPRFREIQISRSHHLSLHITFAVSLPIILSLVNFAIVICIPTCITSLIFQLTLFLVSPQW